MVFERRGANSFPNILVRWHQPLACELHVHKPEAYATAVAFGVPLNECQCCEIVLSEPEQIKHVDDPITCVVETRIEVRVTC